MLKKSLIFGSVALFLAALITLTGCPTDPETDSGGSSGAYKHSIYGTIVDPYQAQDIIDRAIAAGETVYLQHGLSLRPGHINFKNATVVVVGTVRNAGADPLVLNAADANVTFQGSLDLNDDDHYIYKGTAPSGIDTVNLVEFKERLDLIQPTATAAAVRKFKLGSKVNHDYSTSTDGINARVTAQLLRTLYVVEELTVPTDGVSPGIGAGVDPLTVDPLTIVALKTLDVLDSPADNTVFTSGRVRQGTSATLTSTKGNVTLTYPAAATIIQNITVESGKTIKLRGLTGLTIAGKLKGAGTLEVESDLAAGTVTIGHYVIGGGDGNVKFTGAVANVTAVIIRSTGKTSFVNALSGITAESYIAGDVEFLGGGAVGGGLTVTGAGAPADPVDITLWGNVTLKNSDFPGIAAGTYKTISLTNATLTLGAGKTISIGGGKYSGTGATVPLTPVLTAGSEGVTVTAGATPAVLTAAPPLSTSGSTNEDAAKRNANNKLTLSNAGIEITTGSLEVAPEATFEISDATVTTKLGTATDIDIGFLSIADGGKISLTETATAGSPTIDIGDTLLSYATVGTASLAASGGSVTLGNNTLEGAKAASLAVTGNDVAIGLDSGAAVVGGKSLTLKGLTLDLASRGNLGIGYDAARVVNKLILTDGATLKLSNPTEGSTAVDPDPATGLSKIGTLSGANVVRGGISGDSVLQILSNNASKTPKALTLAHDGSGSSVNITGTGGAVVLNKSSTFSNQ